MKKRKQPLPPKAAAPSMQATSALASGPAGSHFEGQVGAFYLLTMLCGAPPRGLPGTVIERVALQQANTGRPLDDVVVHAHDSAGNRAVLEIQVKRTITFAPTDPVFRKVVKQIVEASRRKDFSTSRYELAIATTKGSRKIDGAYQDVLMLARQIGDAATFAAQIDLPGAANDDMRSFVRTFRSHLREEGLDDDDSTTWSLLRQLLILTFDFTATGSESEELARERAAHILHHDEIPRAGALWGNLVEIAIDIAKSSGDRTRETLLQSIAPLGFRFVGERRHAKARAALAEASRLALADIRNRVGKVVLTRQERIAAVYEALDRGRYVEVRGDAGVGKSGVLRQLAERLSAEGQVIVLSPGRCVPRGWQAMRAQIGFEGTIRDLLVELASDGGTILFVDNLDFFSAEERLTIVDIVREAAAVPGISVVATARIGFGIDEPNWLPADALEHLGKTTPIEIQGLSKAEIEQLKVGDPALAPLLADDHPAHQVSRNLFRLARLASQPIEDPLPRTEVDMAEQWWKTADGPRDGGWRDRSRLLQDAAEQTFLLEDVLDVKGRAATPIDALVASGTLRSLGIDRVAFRHYVFREWAIANVVHADDSWIDRLNLEGPAPAMLARGIELAARMAIERNPDGKAWHALADRLSRPGSNLSWRRTALLALVRSEAGAIVLQRASPELLGNQAGLLRELIRAVLAIEVVPASTAFAAAGMDPTLIPASLNVPRGPTWGGLIVWLLSLGEMVPGAAIPEVVEIYNTFSIGTLGITDITPLTTRRLYGWLRQLEPRDAISPPDNGPRFWVGLQREQLQSLKLELRNGFAMFARTTPELAAEYLNAVAQSAHNNELVRSISKMRGTLAQAAPTELAALTAEALIAKPRPRDSHYGIERDDPFTFLDSEFLPASPAQGPFFDILQSSPKDGLGLVRRLVEHAITHASRGRAPGSNVITVAFPDAVLTFPWTQTYFWSRDSHFYGVTSALMALEAWAHRRIDAGEAFETVLADVLGPTGSAAAYLLVAVDLLISHWPNSASVAPAFLACPELLCLDHTRQVHDTLGLPDFGGTGFFRPEPRGAVSSAELKSRASRRMTLDGLIGAYVLMASADQRANFVTLLREAAVRLGPPKPEDTLGDPEFMVQHALNLAEPTNWTEKELTLKDGSVTTVRQYVPPAEEHQHLHALQVAAAGKSSDFATQSAICLATEDPTKLSSEARSTAIEWARRATGHPPSKSDDDDPGSQRMRKEAILTAAMITIRDGDDALRAAHGEWAKRVLEEALQSKDDDPACQIRAGLRFNPTAIAYVGLIHALRHRNSPVDLRAILEIAVRDSHAAAHGFGASVTVLQAIDARLPRALLRCAFTACIVPNHEWDLPEEAMAARAEHRRQRAKAAADAEMAWLTSGANEPHWPAFPKASVHRRRFLHAPRWRVADDDTPDVEPQANTEHVNHQAAALWLRQMRDLLDAPERPWLCEITKCYMPWTIEANGAEMDDEDEADDPPLEWNDAFFALAAHCLTGLSFDEISKLALEPISTLPDQQFFDVLADFLRSVDAVYFGGGDIGTPVAVGIRTTLANRMMSSRGWERVSGSKEMSIEMHIGPAIAVLFFNDHHFVQSTKCYLYAKGVERVDPFLPLLARLVQSAPSPFVALVLLNLLEVAPRPQQLDILVVAVKACLDAYPDFRPFWIDHSFGRRWCLIVESIRTQAPAAIDSSLPIRAELDGIVSKLIGLGIPEASRLEEALAKH